MTPSPICTPVGTAAARFAQAQRGKDAFERLEAVNWYVNKRVRFVDDSRQFGRADVWSAAADTLRRGRGDCEDYAIAKLQMLRRAGFADRDLYLAIVKDLVTRADNIVKSGNFADRFYRNVSSPLDTRAPVFASARTSGGRKSNSAEVTQARAIGGAVGHPDRAPRRWHSRVGAEEPVAEVEGGSKRHRGAH